MSANPIPTETRTASGAPIELPIKSGELLRGLSSERTLELETLHGNGDLMRALDILGIAGPLRTISPWELEDADGRHLIHAGGYAAVPFGEMYPPLIEFIQSFLTENRTPGLPQQSLSEWRAALSTNLVSLLASQTPSHEESQVFFSNSGAEAVETAIKFAKATRPKSKTLINFSRAYHGKTVGALSLTPNEEYQDVFKPLMPGVRTLPYGNVTALERAVKELGPNDIIAVVLEPIQGEGGVITPPKEFLPAVARLAERYGFLTIADEIQSGLGRTGHWFASLAGGLDPDIITLAKPLGGGLVPIGATIARKAIFQTVLGGLESKRHSSTFGGGSLAMAVGLRSLELIAEKGLVERAREMGGQGLARLEAIRERHPGYIKAVRAAGMLFAIELRHTIKPSLVPGNAELARQLGTVLAIRTMHRHGLHVCYSNNASHVIRLTPALNMPIELFEEMFARLERVASHHRGAWQMLPKTPLRRLWRLARLALKS
ncbi:MAG: aspartate aminotransferase family protein [Trueperaceae bacterium]|nr:MAG: aspartate aminotransferase family protein [Trueperaceae bacterium]